MVFSIGSRKFDGTGYLKNKSLARVMKPTLSFHGGAGTVTGSRYLLATGDMKIQIDAGLFQGLKKLRLMNWEGPRFDQARSTT